MSANTNSGILYLVGTPIGNLEDMTFRAIKTLQSVNLIAAEDTRRTGKLLQHFQINTPQISYHAHNQTTRTKELVSHLENGKSVALVTDAGMPGISDPGYGMVIAAIAAKIKIVPVPGVSAALTALTVSGLSTDRFIFEGFLPVKQKERIDRLESLQQETRTIIFYEAPHRIILTISDLGTIFGKDRKIVLARELTKLHEEFWRGTIEEAIELYTHHRQPKGEYTLVVAGKPRVEALILSETELKDELAQLLQQGMTRSQASRYLARLTSLSRRQIYQLALEI
ncbi:MAG: 16S rRNA (cytidine(1402)-2'-O)-methyltransferase [Xenococcaceae cyanobacterium]